jgi:hypothetical protein
VFGEATNQRDCKDFVGRIQRLCPLQKISIVILLFICLLNNVSFALYEEKTEHVLCSWERMWFAAL